MKKIFGISILLLLLILTSCSLDETESSQPIAELNIPEGFDFSSEKDIELEIETQNLNSTPIAGIVFDVFFINENAETRFLMTSQTDSSGEIQETLRVPAYVEKLMISGMMGEQELEIVNNTASFIFSPMGTRGSRNYSPPYLTRQFSYLPNVNYDPQGVPDAIEMIGIDAELMARIAESLPEHYDLDITHPEYLGETVINHLNFTDSTDVWITFVSEGASYQNALGYYTYETSSGAPADPSSLDLTLVYPNCSFVGSGGGMESGMKIHLGKFGGNTTMGWFLVQDGWEGGANVSETAQRYYSVNDYNPEPQPNNQHSVLLYDADYEAFVMGFEDQERPFGDDDFNDAVFLADAIPLSNVDMTDVPELDIPPDGDGDGISDPADDYPDDPDRAFDVYYPSQEDSSTIVFEDLWPQFGDYDMNDFVLDYQYHLVTNADDEIVDLNGNFRLRAMGASYSNGFALQLPYEYAEVSIVGSSDNITPELADYDYVILDLFDNTVDLIGADVQIVYNTNNEDIYREPVDFYVNLTLSNLKTVAELDFGYPFNPFIYQQGDVSHEIHLMNMPATERANTALFGTEDDASVPGNGEYYLSGTNLPWGLNLPQSWMYPAEKNSIVDTYYHFASWAESGGTLYTDWFTNNSGNYDGSLIYQNP